MRLIRRFSAALVILLILLVLTTSATLLIAAAQDPDAGQAQWAEYGCKNCHGESGEGVWAGPLAANDKTVEDWIAQVRAPRKLMPTFSEGQISDQIITDMHAYLTALEKPADFVPAEAELAADAHPGQLLIVEKKCVACHSTAGPIRGFTARQETPTTEVVLAQLRAPRENMPMFDADQVSDAEADTITAFLVTQVAPPSVPETGSLGPSIWMALIPVLGAGLLLSGLALRSWRAPS